MKDNNRAKLLTVGIAVLLILVICGISLIRHVMQKKETADSESRLQADIVEYASSGQPDMTAWEAGKSRQESVQEEEAQKNSDSGRTTVRWQKETNEKLTQVEVDLPRQMSEMKGYWEAGNMEAVEDLAYLPRYRAASAALADTARFYYLGDVDSQNRPHGRGLAMYADNQYYYGDWTDGVRSGSGMWIKYFVYDQQAKAADSLYLKHSYSGGFSNDLPNGEGQEHYDFIDENLEENVGYNRNFIGHFRNGLYDGEMYITDYYKDGNTKEWQGNAVNGVWQPMGEKDKLGQYPVIVQITNTENYQWMKEAENLNQGVTELISAAKQ